MKFGESALLGLALCAIGAVGFSRVQASTQVIQYEPPSILPDHSTAGDCQPSRAAAYRIDAFRCTDGEATFDPCFITSKRGHLLCDVDPRKPSSGTLVSSAAQSTVERRAASSRAWLFELSDGTTCRPLLDNRREIDGLTELYTCKWVIASEADAVLGELNSGAPVWTIQQVLLNKKVEPMTIKSLLAAAVKTVWR